MSHSKHNSWLGTWHWEAFRVHIKTFLQCECKGGFFVVRGAQHLFYLTIFQLYDLGNTYLKSWMTEFLKDFFQYGHGGIKKKHHHPHQGMEGVEKKSTIH